MLQNTASNDFCMRVLRSYVEYIKKHAFISNRLRLVVIISIFIFYFLFDNFFHFSSFFIIYNFGGQFLKNYLTDIKSKLILL